MYILSPGLIWETAWEIVRKGLDIDVPEFEFEPFLAT